MGEQSWLSVSLLGIKGVSMRLRAKENKLRRIDIYRRWRTLIKKIQ